MRNPWIETVVVGVTIGAAAFGLRGLLAGAPMVVQVGGLIVVGLILFGVQLAVTRRRTRRATRVRVPDRPPALVEPPELAPHAQTNRYDATPTLWTGLAPPHSPPDPAHVEEPEVEPAEPPARGA